MKKFLVVVLTCLMPLLLLTGCGGYDYFEHVSDEKSDLFLAETDEFTLTVSCCTRENPYLLDGVVCTKSKLVDAVLAERQPTGAEYEIYFLEDVPKGGDMSFRSVTGDYSYTRSVEEFPSGSVSLRVVKNGTPLDLVATSVKTERTLSTSAALQKAIDAEKERVDALTRDGVFYGEFHVRLLRRDKNYYYVGIIDEQGGILSLLLDSETGEVLARRDRS